MNPLFLETLARLETAGGAKTIKGPNGEDSHNLFNIKDFSGSGYQAFDKAEGSNDRYRNYQSPEASKADAMDMIRRLYPKAYEATTPEEFADGLLNGVGGRKYATDPAYREKIVSVANSVAKATGPGVDRPAVKPAVLPIPVTRTTLADRAPVTPVAEKSFIEKVMAADSILKEDPRAQSYELVNRIVGLDEDKDDPNWTPDPTTEKGLSLAEVEYLHESIPGGSSAYNRRLAEIQENRGRDSNLAELGVVPALVGGLTSQRNNIPGLITMLGTLGVGSLAGAALRTKAAGEAAGVANQLSYASRAAVALSPAQRLAQAGRPGAAIAAAVGEGIVVDSALMIADDTLGRQNFSAGEYTINLASGVLLSSIPELATLPASLRDARLLRMADSTPGTRQEVTADALLNERRAAQDLADDTATSSAPVTTDADATRSNVGDLPELPGNRLGGDRNLGAMLREWNDADESVGRKDTGPAVAESFPILDTAALDEALPSSRLFPEWGKDVDPVWAKDMDESRIRAAREDKPWKDLIKKTGYDGDYDLAQALPPGLYVQPAVLKSEKMAPAVSALTTIAKEMLPGSRITLGLLSKETKASVDGATPGGMIMSAGKTHFIGINPDKDKFSAVYTGIHEIGHAVVHENLKSVHPALLSRMVAEHREFLIQYKAGSALARFRRFSAGNESLANADTGVLHGRLDDSKQVAGYVASFDEYGAEAFVRFIERKAKAANPDMKFDKGVIDAIKSVWANLKKLFDRAMERGYLPKDEAFDEFFQSILDGTNAAQARSPVGVANDPASYSVTSAQARNYSDKVNEAARQALAANPIDQRKLDVLAGLAPERLGAMTAGLVLARSKTPVLQRVAQLITETTTGAAGRQATVAVRRDSVATMLYGDSAQAYTTLADRWAKSEGHGIRDRWFSGDSRREFDRQVYLYKRQMNAAEKGETVQGHPLVKQAAGHLHALYQRSADMKRKAGTIGSDLLPRSSRDYVPQELDGQKLAAASAEELVTIRKTLVDHWVQENEWDESFARGLANLYIDRARSRPFGDSAYGGKMVDSQGIGDVRKAAAEAVEAGYVTSGDVEAAMLRLKKNDKRGGKETRERLDIPMEAQVGPGKQMLDFFVTDQMSLAHRHVQSAAGEIGLTEMGIPGKAGLDRLRLAAVNSTPAPTLAELRAFDQVAAELFGAAPKGAIYSELAQTTRLMTSVLKLGGAAFNQLAETNNLIHSLGLSAALKQIVTLPGYMLDVRRRANGEQVPPGLLDSIESWGGEIGMSDYRINFPLRATDEALREYSEAPGMLSAIVKAGAMAQHKISFFRGIHAAQHRATAEQILLKAARIIKDWDGGALPKPLQDMGFDEALVRKFKDNFANVANYDESGRLVEFDVEGVRDGAATEAFVQAVHRGTRQIIQGTFIGERNAWVHNDWIGLMTQFRTFSITAMEKQWARNRFMQDNKYVGYAYLGGIVAMQSAFAFPIYLARMQSQAMLIQNDEERKKFLDARLNLPAATRGLMNYAGASGLTGDLLEYAMMFGGKSAGIEGARGAGQADVIGSVVPAAGAVNQGARAVGGAVEAALDDKEDNVKVDRVLKALPFSSLWWVTPFINAAKE
jgi:hypothetical protein